MITLTGSQEKAVSHKDGPLLIIAGPGSGKTRVITSRIAALISSGVRPYNICAITFTNKAADAMRQRVLDMSLPSGTHISTFHSLCVRILRRYADRASIGSTFSIYDDADQKKCVKEAIKQADLDTKSFSPQKMRAVISRLKNNLEDVTSFQERSSEFFTKCVARIYKNYQQILTQNNALDFDDLLLKTAFLLRDNSDVRDELNNRFQYLLVDEYQDTNQAQYQIARGLSIAHGNICVTGDPDQSIYAWRGADISNILAFEKDWPEATVVKLEKNFRSTANILDLADRLIVANKQRKLKKLVPTIPPGRDIEANTLEDEQAEAEFIAENIKKLVDNGANLDEIAVFYRVNSMSRTIEEACVHNKIPYQIVRGVEFYNRKEIRDMLAYLKILVNPEDDVALTRIINTPARGIGKTSLDRMAAFARMRNSSLYDAAKQAEQIETLSKSLKAKLAMFVDMIERFKTDINGPVAELMQRVFDESKLRNSLETVAAEEAHSKASAVENVEELINSAFKYDTVTDEPNLADYLLQIALVSDTDAYDPQSGRASLMTMHAAKGLEFDNVFISGLEQGLLPHERSVDDDKGLEEERRLFFVGITRARKTLNISLARYRTVHGQTMRTIPSQFLFEADIIAEDIRQEQEQLYEDDFSQAFDYSANSTAAFSKGQAVIHAKFGSGRVKEFHDLGENSIVVVSFNTGQTKPLMLKYANLTKV